MKTVLFKCSQLNDNEIVEKNVSLFQTVQFKSLFVSKTKLGVRFECFVIVSLKKNLIKHDISRYLPSWQDKKTSPLVNGRMGTRSKPSISIFLELNWNEIIIEKISFDMQSSLNEKYGVSSSLFKLIQKYLLVTVSGLVCP